LLPGQAGEAISQVPEKTKKGVTTWWPPPFLEIGMLFQVSVR
jgi:hypothetical protein